MCVCVYLIRYNIKLQYDIRVQYDIKLQYDVNQHVLHIHNIKLHYMRLYINAYTYKCNKVQYVSNHNKM